MRVVVAVLAVLIGTWPASAQDAGERPSAERAPAARKATPAPKGKRAQKAKSESTKGLAARLRDSYAAIPEAERRAIQVDLIWTGDYEGIASAEITDSVVAAVKAFQRRNRTTETGILNPQERAALAAAAKLAQDRVGWRIVDDTVTGAKVGIPAKQVPQAGTGRTGSRWSSAKGEVQVETFRISGPGTTLPAVFEAQKKDPPQRRVESGSLRPDFFVITGLQGLKKFHVRAYIQGSEVRGLTILYDQFNEGIMDPVALAMSGAFVPFPGGAAAVVAPVPKRKVEYGTGIVVSSSGHVVTHREVVDDCQFVTLGDLGSGEVVADDKTSDLALVRVYGARNLAPVVLAGEAPKGNDVTIVGIADPQVQAGGNAVSTVLARLGGSPDSATRSVEPAPALGFAGAAAIDGQGRLIGMVELKSPGAAFVPAATIGKFLAAQNVKPGGGRSSVEEMKAAVVRVICVRK